jgi:hypothetical protein
MELEKGGVVEAEGVDVDLENVYGIMETQKAMFSPGKEVYQRLEAE